MCFCMCFRPLLMSNIYLTHNMIIANGIHVFAHKMSCNLCLSSESLLITSCTNDGRSYTSENPVYCSACQSYRILKWSHISKVASCAFFAFWCMIVCLFSIINFYLHTCFLQIVQILHSTNFLFWSFCIVRFDETIGKLTNYIFKNKDDSLSEKNCSMYDDIN